MQRLLSECQRHSNSPVIQSGKALRRKRSICHSS